MRGDDRTTRKTVSRPQTTRAASIVTVVYPLISRAGGFAMAKRGMAQNGRATIVNWSPSNSMRTSCPGSWSEPIVTSSIVGPHRDPLAPRGDEDDDAGQEHDDGPRCRRLSRIEELHDDVRQPRPRRKPRDARVAWKLEKES